MAEGWQVNNAHLEAEDRKGYLYLRVRGELRTVAEVERASALVLDWLAQLPSAKLLLDVRGLKLPLPDDACHAAWQFIHSKSYELLACAFPEDSADLMVTRMNMTGLSTGLPFRAFASIVDAHRWLELKPSGIHRRMPSQVMAATQAPRDGQSTTPSAGLPAASAEREGKPAETPAFRSHRTTGAHRQITGSTSAGTLPVKPSSMPPPSPRNGKSKQSDE